MRNPPVVATPAGPVLMTATRTADPTALDLPGGEGHGRGDALTFRCDEFWSTNELTIN
ncbi:MULTISPECIES: hypothetical protein [unclassified Nonomuraea]|uniref:hypothetical protein n=1 Tax=unclassified Nonomuraea TaxID=2593643 RepID=UPI0033F04791